MWHSGKKITSLVDCHVEDVGYRFSFEAYFDGFAIIAFSVAYLARNQHIRQEIHFYGLVTVSVACLASASGHVERKASGFVAADFSFGEVDEQGPYVGKYACICCRIRTWRSSERRLVDGYDLVDILQPYDFAIGKRFCA